MRRGLADVRLFVRLTLLTATCGLLTWGTAPYAVGWHTTMITSGSMAPAVRPGDLVVIAPLGPAQAATTDLTGLVIQFEDPGRPDRLVLHRVVRPDGTGKFITKGDANITPDSTPVPLSAVRGLARLRVPAAGLPMLWLRTGQRLPLSALGLVLLVLLRPERRATPASPAGSPAASAA